MVSGACWDGAFSCAIHMHSREHCGVIRFVLLATVLLHLFSCGTHMPDSAFSYKAKAHVWLLMVTEGSQKEGLSGLCSTHVTALELKLRTSVPKVMVLATEPLPSPLMENFSEIKNMKFKAYIRLAEGQKREKEFQGEPGLCWWPPNHTSDFLEASWSHS